MSANSYAQGIRSSLILKGQISNNLRNVPDLMRYSKSLAQRTQSFQRKNASRPEAPDDSQKIWPALVGTNQRAMMKFHLVVVMECDHFQNEL